MKINVFQKILSLLYLIIILIICIFFIPFKKSIDKFDTKVIFDAIWTDNSNIDLYRLFLMLFPLSIIFYFIFIYLSKINVDDQSSYKNKAKTEVRIFVVFILSLVATVLIFIFINLVNHIRVNIIDNKVYSTNLFINENSVKLNARRDFFISSKYYYNLEEYDNNVSKYWDFLMKSKNDDDWLNYYYDNFDVNTLMEFDINNPTELHLFIVKNSFTAKDWENFKIIENLKEDLNVIMEKRSSIYFYNYQDIRYYLLLVFVLLFVSIYILRPIYFFLKGLLYEVS